ncbi:hypothetical protein LY78DRAFT_665470 [Colletotrichum sublineola]|uniref:DUF7707 domain-containing protein n=1 Tax=Colletotrichum sublineola TaxID=1173701 RepID=A0A066XH37_COLSU|nr:hypothetical protein LY78DRAFT_665470 [Colletotrichum sublineola]KDN68508.1 hypothetical protein CSUB01_03406 [Colletotrichum sublineola]
MPSFKSTLFAVAAAFVATAHADYFVEPDSVPLSTRKSWCQDQKYSCPVICDEVSTKPVEVNECDPQALTYGCICGDGNQPNMSEYSLTLPYHVCQEYGNQCVAKCGIGSNTCANNCRVDNPCGAQNPTRVNTTTTASATASATESANAVYTGIAGSPSGSGSGSGSSGAATLEMGRSAGLAVLVGGVIGGVAFLL